MSPSNDLRGQLAALEQAAGRTRQHQHRVETCSTNDDALAWLKASGPEKARHGALVTADQQSAGRGRLGRHWQSRANSGLYASVVLRPQAPAFGLGPLSLVVGVALAEGLELCCPGLAVDLKWPNDLVVDGRKLGGILCECRWQGSRPDIVVGFGINLRPVELDEPGLLRPTSLGEQLSDGSDGSVLPGRAVLLAAVLDRLEQRTSQFFRSGFQSLRGAYLGRCSLQGRKVQISVDARHEPQSASGSGDTRSSAANEPRVAHEVLGLDADGALLVKNPTTGEPQRVQSADVWLASPGS